MKSRIITLIILTVTSVSMAQDSTSFFSEPGDGGIVMKRYIDVPIANTDLQLSGDWTIEAMLRMPPGFDLSQMYIVESYGSSTSNGGFALRLSNQRIQAYAMGAGVQPNIIGNQIIQEDTWTHIAASYNEAAGIMSVYVNGSLDNSMNLGVDQFTNTQTMRIGARGDDADVNHFSLIDEVRIWEVVRDSVELQAKMNSCLTGNETGLLAYYTFENDSGATVTDQSQNGNDGTIINPLVSGNYQNGAYSCDLTANLNDFKDKNIYVYPNPATNFISIACESKVDKVTILDISGAVVQTETINSFSIATLKPGIYFLEVSTYSGQQKIKLQKL